MLPFHFCLAGVDTAGHEVTVPEQVGKYGLSPPSGYKVYLILADFAGREYNILV